MRRPPLLVLVMVLTLMLVATGSVAARSKVSLGIASPDSTNPAMVDQVTNLTGSRPALWALWSDWGDLGGQARCVTGIGSCGFPIAAARELRNRRITPFIWWQPTDPANPTAGKYERYQNIISGKHDKYIKAWAKAAKRFGKPVIVRFAHEMNGSWFPWALTKFDNNPAKFKKAWKRIVKKFRAVGANNVRFLWSPYRQGCRGCTKAAYGKFYPGDAYVDYVGVSVLNWGASWQPMTRLLKKPMNKLRAVTRKPVILPEVASNHTSGNKAAWIKSGYKKAVKQWPNIRAIVYFDYDTSPVGQPDWRLIQPPDGSALRAYRSIASNKTFRASIP